MPTQITQGNAHFAAGDGPDQAQVIASEELSVWNTADGQSTTPYLDPNPSDKDAKVVGKPEDKGIVIPAPTRYSKPVDAHRGPSENLMFLIEPDNDVTLDQDSFNVRIAEQIVNLNSGVRRTEIWKAGDHETDTKQGGVPKGKSPTGGIKSPAYVTPELGPNEWGKAFGRPRFDPYEP